jgi:hypothetical protein
MKHPDHFDFVRRPLVAYEKIIKDAKRIEERLAHSGVSPASNSRIVRYRKIIELFLNIATGRQLQTHMDLRLLHQAIFEVGQIETIVEEFLKPPVSSEWRSRVLELISGQPLPQTEKEQSKARDIQFELFVAARCRASGYLVEPKEPDILVQDEHGNFGIAAKRPKSPKTLERRIRKGSHQIDDSGMPGILAIDLSLIHNPENKILLFDKQGDDIEIVQRIADRFVQLNSRRIRSMVKLPNVFGIVVCMASLSFVSNTLQFASATRWTITNLCEMSDPHYEQLRNFAARFAAGVS